MFLLNATSHLPYQDCQLKPQWRTLAYAQVLQYWAEKVNPPVPDKPRCLAMCVHELRWHMKRYMTFSDYDVFEGLMHRLPGVEIKEATQPNPIEPSPVDAPAALMVAPSVSENASATLITTPAISKEESVTPNTTPAALVDELANPPTPLETTGDVRSLTEPEYSKWVKIHLSHVVASVGSIPSNPGTSGSATTTVAPVSRKELSTTWMKNSGPSEAPPAQPCMEPPQSWHPKRRKTQKLDQRCHLWDSKRSPCPWLQANPQKWKLTAL